jgi:hypothetical protein
LLHRSSFSDFGTRESGGKTAALQKLQEHGSEMNAKNRPNGHGALMAKSHGANGSVISLHGTGRAASDDASELSVANASASSAAAGAERKAYADVARAQGKGRRLAPTAASRSLTQEDPEKTVKSTRKKIPPGTEPLPIDGEAFVDAVHAQVDLVQLEVKLLKSEDEKIVQREVAYLRELRYGRRALPVDDEAPQIILDMQRPERESS